MTNQAVIVLRRPPGSFFGAWRSILVRIDGRRAGKVKPGETGEFPVEPGERTVQLWMDWARSLPLQLVVEPGARIELAVRNLAGRAYYLKTSLPIIIAGLIARPVTQLVLTRMGLTDVAWWVRLGLDLGLMFLMVFGSYILISSYFSTRWAMWKLEPIEEPTREGPPAR